MATHSSIPDCTETWTVFHEQRSLAGYSPQGHKELDTTERQTLSLSSHSAKNEDFGRRGTISSVGGGWWDHPLNLVPCGPCRTPEGQNLRRSCGFKLEKAP